MNNMSIDNSNNSNNNNNHNTSNNTNKHEKGNNKNKHNTARHTGTPTTPVHIPHTPTAIASKITTYNGSGINIYSNTNNNNNITTINAIDNATDTSTGNINK